MGSKVKNGEIISNDIVPKRGRGRPKKVINNDVNNSIVKPVNIPNDDEISISSTVENSSIVENIENIELVNNPVNIPTIDNIEPTIDNIEPVNIPTIDSNYNRVLISSLYVRNTKNPIRTEEEYKAIFKKLNNSQGGLCEIVGIDSMQVKAYFDVDY